MKNTLFKKGLVAGIIILFIGLAFIPSFNAESIKEETSVEEDREENYSPPKLVGFPIHHKDYYNCRIYSECYNGVSGHAFLFPGYFKSDDYPIKVKNASGILVHGQLIFFTDSLIINGHWWNPEFWNFAIVIGYTGILRHGSHMHGGIVFDINGYAAFVRIYYE